MRLALLGYPLSHSLSPVMHNATLAHVGLSDWSYEAWPVEPARLGEAVATLRGSEYAGANVTVPYKEAVIPFLDGLTPVAQAIGAVNTIVKRPHPPAPSSKGERESGGEELIGHNTDAAGWLADLHALGVAIAGQIVLVLGAGGAARAAVAGCASVGASVRILARRREQSSRLQSLISHLEIFEYTPSGLRRAAADCALIVNCTPLGMAPNVDGSPWLDGVPFPPGAFVYDMVYNPAETRLTRQARAAGLRAATGLGMLVEQGALAFELWTGHPAPRALMRAAAEAELNSRFA
ncbi:MAG: shikimate dehydrogenase [Anaerolineales bacterium]|nr:shikimate dehydrogenase [Anaerolineales bacterium]